MPSIVNIKKNVEIANLFRLHFWTMPVVRKRTLFTSTKFTSTIKIENSVNQLEA